MKSLTELYKIGPGSSSSHTLAVQRACELFKEQFNDAVSFEVNLYNSLSLTAKGHHTIDIIEKVLNNQVKVNLGKSWHHDYACGLDITGFDAHDQSIAFWEVASVGGGSIKIIGEDFGFEDEVYPHQDFDSIREYCMENRLRLSNYVYQYEPDIKSHMYRIVKQMLATVANGLKNEGRLPGPLDVNRVAKDLLIQSGSISPNSDGIKMKIMSYAYAASEENAAGGTCVTAPTLGASGVIAALVYHYYYDLETTIDNIIDGLIVAGIFGNVIKTNATLAGSEGGCQAEIGSACAMGSAFVSYLDTMDTEIVEYAAEIGIEHHLGLTCDPVEGYVIIPCIERNGIAVIRCLDAALLAKNMFRIRRNMVSFDSVVRTMNYTGKMIIPELRETSLGGLAKEIEINPKN